jgi:hypothetical protein
MSERKIHTIEDVEQLMLWMQCPPNQKPVITFDAEQYLERLQRADVWLRTHMSTRKVWPMMLAHYQSKGIAYSERTARRDVTDAQRLFSSLDGHTAKYWTSLMLDVLQEKLVSAHIGGKLTELARLSKEIREWLRYADEQGVRDTSKLLDEVPRVLLFDPSETGVEPVPNALELAQEYLEARKVRLKAKNAVPVTDAHYTEVPPADEAH